MQWIYSILYTAGFLVALPYFLILGLIKGKYLSTVFQRFGSAPEPRSQNVCWLHAVSVGEFLAARPLLKKIREDFPEIEVYVSTTTITGQKLARDHAPDASFFFPFDWSWCVRRVFKKLQPRLVLVMETEIWPNFLWEARRNDVPVILLNGRLSDASYRRYSIVRKFLPLFEKCLMQTQKDAERISSLGARDVAVMGNMKFDFQPPELSQSLEKLLMSWKKNSLLWIAGSTMKGEESIVLRAFARLKVDFPLKLLLAARHPERFADVAELVKQSGFTCALKSHGQPAEAEVLILDTIGELASCYQLADVVFVGGTLLEGGGGHNPIEPAFFGKPIVTGPFYVNFQSVIEEFRKRKAIYVCSGDIAAAVREVLMDRALNEDMGREAKKLVAENSGATQVALQCVREFWNAGNPLEQGSQLSVQ